jgi:CheY-like chemotaxis protein
MDGWATLQAIKDNPVTKSIPVIMITGKQIEGKDREVFAPLFYDYLTKPIRRAELCSVVRKAVGQT